MTPCSRGSWLGAVAIVLWATAVGAQAKPDYEAAKLHYLSAKKAHAGGEYDRAVREYILAYDITHDPSLFKQIAISYEAAGQKPEAAVYYRRYLAEGKPGADADDVRARIAALEEKAPATQPAAQPPPPGETPVEEPVETTPAAVPVVPPAPAMITDERGSWMRTAGWVSVGLAAAALTTGAVLATSAMAREEDIDQLIEFRDPVTRLPREYSGTVREDYQQKVDEGTKLSRFATVSFVAGGAFAGAAIVFFILDATRGVEKTSARVVPSVGPQGAGIVVGWDL